MKKTVKQLRDLIAELKEQRKAIHDKSVEEKRSLTDDEKTKWGELGNQIRSTEDELKIEEEAEAENAKRAANPTNKPLGKESNEEKRQKDLNKFSLLRLIRSQVPAANTPFDGIEREMSQEAAKEAEQSNLTLRGIGIPSLLFQHRSILERRDNSVTMPTQPEDGSAVVQTEKIVSMADMARNALVTASLGATVFSDLVGNVDWVRMKERPKATFKAEVGNLDKSNIKYGPVASLSPKRLGTFIIQSLQFLKQTSPAIEAQARRELAYSVAEGIDYAAIYGSGSNNEPLGLMNDPDVVWLALGANGGYLDRGKLIAAETALMERNLQDVRPKWLLNARTRGYLKNAPIATGSDKFLMESNADLLEYPAVMSNVVPNDGTKGTTTTPSLSSLVFGDWKNLYIGQWGGLELLVNPYSLGRAGQIEVDVQAFVDTTVYDPAAFTGYKDVKNVAA